MNAGLVLINSFASLIRKFLNTGSREGTETGCGVRDGEAGHDTDEHEFLEEQEADMEVTEAGDFLSEELVFCGSDVCALFPVPLVHGEDGG